MNTRILCLIMLACPMACASSQVVDAAGPETSTPGAIGALRGHHELDEAVAGSLGPDDVVALIESILQQVDSGSICVTGGTKIYSDAQELAWAYVNAAIGITSPDGAVFPVFPRAQAENGSLAVATLTILVAPIGDGCGGGEGSAGLPISLSDAPTISASTGDGSIVIGNGRAWLDWVLG